MLSYRQRYSLDCRAVRAITQVARSSCSELCVFRSPHVCSVTSSAALWRLSLSKGKTCRYVVNSDTDLYYVEDIKPNVVSYVRQLSNFVTLQGSNAEGSAFISDIKKHNLFVIGHRHKPIDMPKNCICLPKSVLKECGLFMLIRRQKKIIKIVIISKLIHYY